MQNANFIRRELNIRNAHTKFEYFAFSNNFCFKQQHKLNVKKITTNIKLIY